MVILTLTTLSAGDASWTPFSSATLSISEILGYGLLAIGILATALSSQRYLLLYALAGMGYWLVIEGIQYALTAALPLSSWHGYVAAMALSWLPLCAWIIARAWRHDSISIRGKSRQTVVQQRYIEHTPVYDEYQPKFQ